ncbi:hypothetical protein Rctr16k_24 [Virus Rctr16k]|nr:hypothetical protein Rctr16k_24 [Virus Rctr16k]
MSPAPRPTLMPDGALSVPRGWGDSDIAADMLEDVARSPVQLPDGRWVPADQVPDLADELESGDD